jgi:glutamate dehydrogenase
MRLEFLRQHCAKKGDPLDCVGHWVEAQALAIRQFRTMIGRAQNTMAVTPAMLAQVASQARSLLGR